MVLARPVAPQQVAPPVAPPAPVVDRATGTVAAQSMGTQLRSQMDTIAASGTPRPLHARLLGRHPLPRQELAIEAAVSRRGTAELLAHQPPGSTVLHDVPGPDGQPIHHLLIGPTGVYVISTLQVPQAMVMVVKDDLLVSGRQTGAIAEVEEQARWVGERLGLTQGELAARPVLVVNGYRHLSVRQGPDVTSVLSTRGLREFLTRRVPALAEDRVAELVDRASSPQTWLAEPSAAITDGTAAPGEADSWQFDDLVESVRRARRTRAVLGFIAAVVTLDVLVAGWVWIG